MLGLTGAAAFVLGRRKRLGTFEVLLLTGCAILSFRSRRDLWLVVLAAAGILSTGPFRFADASPEMPWTPHRRAALAGALIPFSLALGLARSPSPPPPAPTPPP